LIGHLLFWSGSSELLRSFQIFGTVPPVAVVLVVAGALLIVAAIATVAVGSLGAIIIGVLHLGFTLLLYAFPFTLRGGFAPGFQLMNSVRSVSMEISDGMYFYLPTGFALVTGTIFLIAGLAASARRSAQATSRARVLSGLAGVLGLVGLMLAFAGGARGYLALLVLMSGVDVLGIVLLVAGSALVSVAVYAARWSSAGALLAGAVVSLAGLAGLAAPIALSGSAVAWFELRRAFDIAGPSGVLLLIGLLLVVTALAVRVRARRAAGRPAMASRPSDELPPPTTAPSV
ncbi:MAG: hypothetical protein ABIQ01_07815, partial [Pseudolysinimonas sp.]